MTKNYFKIKDISNFINRNYNIKFFSSKNEKDYKIICENLHNELSKIKNEIDYTTDWDRIKKIINTYERIYIPNNESVAKYKPISRAYFKLWETFYDFPNLGHNLEKPISSLHLAEGPGGFIEAFQNYRKNLFQMNDKTYATTLAPSESRIPGWKGKIQMSTSNVNLFYGDICSNDYYLKVEAMMENQKADIITADGAFDCSDDFNKQERSSAKLIFCEIVLALSNQKIHGSFIIKIFDIFDIITVKILYLLSIYYNDVFITKPLTSREGNSEKYIVCQNFKGIDNKEIIKLNSLISLWNNCNDYVIDLFDFDLPENIIKDITDINDSIVNRQITSLNRGIKIIKNGIEQQTVKLIETRQIQMAIKWCKKYQIRYEK